MATEVHVLKNPETFDLETDIQFEEFKLNNPRVVKDFKHINFSDFKIEKYINTMNKTFKNTNYDRFLTNKIQNPLKSGKLSILKNGK